MNEFLFCKTDLTEPAFFHTDVQKLNEFLLYRYESFESFYPSDSYNFEIQMVLFFDLQIQTNSHQSKFLLFDHVSLLFQVFFHNERDYFLLTKY